VSPVRRISSDLVDYKSGSGSGSVPGPIDTDPRVSDGCAGVANGVGLDWVGNAY